MSKKLYPDVAGGQSVYLDWRHKDYMIACCDCHLVHRFRFSVVGGKIRIRGWRDNRRTGALRRYRGVPVKEVSPHRDSDAHHKQQHPADEQPEQ